MTEPTLKEMRQQGRDPSTHFYLKNAMETVDKMASKDLVDAIGNLEFLQRYVSLTLAEKKAAFKDMAR